MTEKRNRTIPHHVILKRIAVRLNNMFRGRDTVRDADAGSHENMCVWRCGHRRALVQKSAAIHLIASIDPTVPVRCFGKPESTSKQYHREELRLGRDLRNPTPDPALLETRATEQVFVGP
jgi:hypothetical protein